MSTTLFIVATLAVALLASPAAFSQDAGSDTTVNPTP